jgi:CRP/FNR family transcriptional regulator, cyclic AMP receptor protein
MNSYESYDHWGYLASLLVLATFSVRGMVALRTLAIASNLAFIGYAALAQIYPVLLLHALLLPVNLSRLSQALRAQLVCDEEKFKPTRIS